MELTPEEIVKEHCKSLGRQMVKHMYLGLIEAIREYGKQREITGYKDGFEDGQNGYKYKPNRIE